MPVLEYNEFYKWIQTDNILWQPWQILEWDNMDGLKTGYWITLWPKVNKKRLVWSKPICIISSSYIGCENWEIYELGWADIDTAYYTFASWESVVKGIIYWGYWYFFTKPADETFSQVNIYRITIADFGWGTFTSLWSTWATMNNEVNPPVLETKSFMFIWGLDTIKKVASSWWTATDHGYFDWNVAWLSLQWTTLKVYSFYWDKWRVAFWDTTLTSISSQQETSLLPNRITTDTITDYIVARDWSFNLWSWYETQEISHKVESLRLEDNSGYSTHLDFAPANHDNNPLTTYKWDILVKANDETACIYKYWEILNWITPSLHKIITRNHLWNTIDAIRDISYKTSIDTLYFCCSSWTDYSIESVDASSLTTAQDWYFVTPVFRWPPNKINKITELRATTSYTSGDNYIKIYKRIDNWAWGLIRTINNATDVIKRDKITTNSDGSNLSRDFVDIQFKVEIHNDLQTNLPPILHWLELTYSITQDS